MRSFLVAAALTGAALAPFCPAAAESPRADVALVLAVDVSGSVSDDRFQLQREGIAQALDSDDFAAMLSAGGLQTIELAVVEWAEEQKVVLPWSILHGRQDLAAAAQLLRSAPRSWVHTKTDPGGGIAAAADLMGHAPLPADRQVIDVSGDGAQNTGEITAAEARDGAIARGITINGLPITSGEEPHVDDWYRANVVGGPGAFMVVADGFDAFADAFRRKLQTEVAGLAPYPTLACNLP